MSDNSVSPSFDKGILAFLNDKERIEKMYSIRKENKPKLKFEKFFEQLLEQHLDWREKVLSGELTEDKQVVEFSDLFPDFAKILGLVVREDPAPVFTDLLEKISEIENVEFENDNRDVIYSQRDFPNPKALKKVISMYFQKIVADTFEMKSTVSPKSKQYLSTILLKFLKCSGIDEEVDINGDPIPLNLEVIGIRFQSAKVGKDEFKVTMEYASGFSEGDQRPLIIKHCLITFAEKFVYYDSIDNTGDGMLSKEKLKHINQALLPGKPFEINIAKRKGKEVIEIFGIKEYADQVTKSVQLIMLEQSTLEAEAAKLNNDSDLNISNVMIKKRQGGAKSPEAIKEEDEEADNDGSHSNSNKHSGRYDESNDSDFEDEKRLDNDDHYKMNTMVHQAGPDDIEVEPDETSDTFIDKIKQSNLIPNKKDSKVSAGENKKGQPMISPSNKKHAIKNIDDFDENGKFDQAMSIGEDPSESSEVFRSKDLKMDKTVSKELRDDSDEDSDE